MIRALQLLDARAIHEIATKSLGYAPSLALVESQIAKLMKDSHYITQVFEDDLTQKVVEFVQAEIYEAVYSEAGLNILALAVLPAYHGQGIGRQLMCHIEDYAQQNDFKFIRLNSAEHREDAHHFYEKIGDTCDKTQKRFIKYV